MSRPPLTSPFRRTQSDVTPSPFGRSQSNVTPSPSSSTDLRSPLLVTPSSTPSRSPLIRGASAFSPSSRSSTLQHHLQAYTPSPLPKTRGVLYSIALPADADSLRRDSPSPPAHLSDSDSDLNSDSASDDDDDNVHTIWESPGAAAVVQIGFKSMARIMQGRVAVETLYFFDIKAQAFFRRRGIPASERVAYGIDAIANTQLSLHAEAARPALERGSWAELMAFLCTQALPHRWDIRMKAALRHSVMGALSFTDWWMCVAQRNRQLALVGTQLSDEALREILLWGMADELRVRVEQEGMDAPPFRPRHPAELLSYYRSSNASATEDHSVTPPSPSSRSSSYSSAVSTFGLYDWINTVIVLDRERTAGPARRREAPSEYRARAVGDTMTLPLSDADENAWPAGAAPRFGAAAVVQASPRAMPRIMQGEVTVATLYAFDKAARAYFRLCGVAEPQRALFGICALCNTRLARAASEALPALKGGSWAALVAHLCRAALPAGWDAALAGAMAGARMRGAPFADWAARIMLRNRQLALVGAQYSDAALRDILREGLNDELRALVEREDARTHRAAIDGPAELHRWTMMVTKLDRARAELPRPVARVDDATRKRPRDVRPLLVALQSTQRVGGASEDREADDLGSESE